MGSFQSCCSCCDDGEEKYIRYGEKSNDFTNPKYDEQYQESINKREEFWLKQAKELSWAEDKEPTKALDTDDKNFDKWFPDGEMNITFNCLDRHLDNEKGENIAIAYSSPQTKISCNLDYEQVIFNAGKVANVLKNEFKVQKGDCVFIYMPNIPMTICTMLSCARMGAVHNISFGGLPEDQLAARLDDAMPKLIFTCSGGFDPVEESEKTEENLYKVVKYRPILDAAIAKTTKMDKSIPKIIYQRPEAGGILKDDDVDPAQYHNYKEYVEGDQYEEEDADMVPSNHPLYCRYTSGTTGNPKGIIRDHGSTAVALQYAMKHVFNVTEKSVHFAACGLAWDIGHNFMVYGPFLMACKSVIWEGDPLYPDSGVLWTIVEKHGVTNLYINISMLREVKKHDYDGEMVKESNISTLETICLVGERGDADTIQWIHTHFPDVIINDTYFTTETLWPICGNMLNTEAFETVFPTLPGSVTKGIPGFEVKVLDEEGKEAGQDKLGKVCIKRPLPPGCFVDIVGAEKDNVLKTYYEFDGFFSTGDLGIVDEDGYIKIMCRQDEVITLADGTVMTTGQIEDSMNEREEVAESAVCKFNSKSRGEVPLAFVVLKVDPKQTDEKEKSLPKPDSEKQDEQKQASRQVRKNVNTDCGAASRLIGVIFVERLPKTRSGQIVRRCLKSIGEGEECTIACHPTISDEDVIKQCEEAFKKWSEPTEESELSAKETKARGCCGC